VSEPTDGDPTLTDLTVEQARARMIAAVPPGRPERVDVGAGAIGRVLAEPVAAKRDQPVFDVSAMDGYALRPDDPAWPTFRVIGESAAGRPFGGAVTVGEAVRVFTGARVPDGCAVVVQERAARDGGAVGFEGVPPESGAHVRSRAGDFHAGQALLAAGMRLDPWRLALAASAGHGRVAVHARPRVAILSTGEEIVPAGTDPAPPAAIFDSNGPALSALVAQWGGVAVRLPPARDSEAEILARIDRLDVELIVTVGGASVGDYDLVKPALARLGLELRVQTIRLRPGKPTWFGVLADGRYVLGLPGNPASSLVAAELFLRPLLAAWTGAHPALAMVKARLAHPLGPSGPREHWMRAALTSGEDGTRIVAPMEDQDSSRVRVFAEADALLRRPAAAPPAQAGDVVEVLPLTRL
jgi:molybdopterin molybdotransferase